jgi:hypothetical protein
MAAERVAPPMSSVIAEPDGTQLKQRFLPESYIVIVKETHPPYLGYGNITRRYLRCFQKVKMSDLSLNPEIDP